MQVYAKSLHWGEALPQPGTDYHVAEAAGSLSLATPKPAEKCTWCDADIRKPATKRNEAAWKYKCPECGNAT